MGGGSELVVDDESELALASKAISVVNSTPFSSNANGFAVVNWDCSIFSVITSSILDCRTDSVARSSGTTPLSPPFVANAFPVSIWKSLSVTCSASINGSVSMSVTASNSTSVEFNGLQSRNGLPPYPSLHKHSGTWNWAWNDSLNLILRFRFQIRFTLNIPIYLANGIRSARTFSARIQALILEAFHFLITIFVRFTSADCRHIFDITAFAH